MEITLNFKGEELTYQCNNTKEKVKDIFHTLKNKIDLNSITFLYSGIQIDGYLSISKIINSSDIERNKMSILVTEKKNELNSCWINSKDIIYPKCGESAKFDIIDYKMLL